MRRNDIPRRSASDADRLVFDKKPLSYNKKSKLNKKEELLRCVALMLYWAEGAKTSKWNVDFTNSNSQMALIFLTALRKIYRVNESRLRILLYCYPNQNVNLLLTHWSILLSIPKAQFTKPYIRKKFDPQKKNKMPNGLIHIRYHDKKLFMQIKAEIDIIANNLLTS